MGGVEEGWGEGQAWTYSHNKLCFSCPLHKDINLRKVNQIAIKPTVYETVVPYVTVEAA